MSLPEKVIDRLFQRLAATYGAQWLAMWRGIPIEDVKAAWAHELAGFGRRLDALAYALENLPERPPNVIEFRRIARLAPSDPDPVLPAPPPDPARVKAAMDAARAMRAALPSHQDPLAWAQRIIDRAQAGEHVHHGTLSLARQALQRRIEA